MATVDQFCSLQNEVSTLLDSLQTTSEYASKLLRFVFYSDDFDNDTGEIKSLTPCAVEHFENLQKVAKQTSSFADRFCASLNKFKALITEIESKKDGSDYLSDRRYFFFALDRALAKISGLQFTFNDALTYSCTDAVDLKITKNGKSALIVITPTPAHNQMVLLYPKNNQFNGYRKYASLIHDNIDASINQIVAETVDYLDNM